MDLVVRAARLRDGRVADVGIPDAAEPSRD